MHLVHSQVTISFQDMSITQRRKSPVYQFFNLWNSLISYFSKFLTRYKESEYKLMLSFFSVHFSPFSNFNNKSDNTNFSYHLNLSSLLSLYHPRVTIVAGHVIPTLSERWDTAQLRLADRHWAKTAHNHRITILPHSSSDITFVHHIFQAVLIIFSL